MVGPGLSPGSAAPYHCRTGSPTLRLGRHEPFTTPSHSCLRDERWVRRRRSLSAKAEAANRSSPTIRTGWRSGSGGPSAGSPTDPRQRSHGAGNMLGEGAVLPGQETLVASWQALARLSYGATLIRTSAAVAAVFPSWLPLNNAIMFARSEGGGATAAASQLTRTYADAGVDSWAFWVPSGSTDLDAPDDLREIGAFKRDTTTLVMQAS